MEHVKFGQLGDMGWIVFKGGIINYSTEDYNFSYNLGNICSDDPNTYEKANKGIRITLELVLRHLKSCCECRERCCSECKDIIPVIAALRRKLNSR